MDLSKYAAGTRKFMSKALYDPEQRGVGPARCG